MYYFLLYFFLPVFAYSCSPYNYTCGNYTLAIQYPFSSDTDDHGCQGLYVIHCMNLAPLVQLHGQGFYYPVWNISYSDKTLIVHDLRLSSYFRGSDCVFLYEFDSPIPRFNVSNFTQNLVSSKPFFNCNPNSYDYSHDVFKETYNLTHCKDYNLYYSNNAVDQNVSASPSYCSAPSGIWFVWKFSFAKDDENFSLISAGFSKDWTPFSDCFSCQIVGANCNSKSSGGGYSTCGCNSQCRGVITGSNSAKKKWLIIAVVCAIGGLFIVCMLCFIFYKRKSKKQSLITSSTRLIKDISSKSLIREDLGTLAFCCLTHVFCYKELEEATNSFDPSNELGDGGYGTVYKGVLLDGRVVAVKRLYETNCKRVEQFMNEVELLSRLRHPNLVTLYGSTSPHSPHLLLVYEFIPNGTLADHLHSPLRFQSLSLAHRLSIAIDIAAALAYLHSVEVIHRDVKTHNILIDNNFNAKVADFGLSRLFPTNATHISTAPQGTPGYLDPEYQRFYQLTDKSDVYSFGVVLMELISSLPAVDIERRPNEISLAITAVTKIQKGELEQLVDPKLGFHSDQEVNRVVTQLAELAFRCLQMDREMRPCIKEVLKELKEINGEKSKVMVKNPCSPYSVIDDWVSKSTTPNSSDAAIC